MVVYRTELFHKAKGKYVLARGQSNNPIHAFSVFPTITHTTYAQNVNLLNLHLVRTYVPIIDENDWAFFCYINKQNPNTCKLALT